MAYRCWTCGADVEGYRYSCATCRNLPELKSLRKSAESQIKAISQQNGTGLQSPQIGFGALQKIQQEGLKVFDGRLPAAIAAVIEWGFGEIEWRLLQQAHGLQSLAAALKTPGQLQAEEWRNMAEELRCRGVLDESEEFYRKALDLNRLDYRMYVGLAITYLQGQKFEQAQSILERSLPHAPVREIDYKSYSYRLLGHIYGCAENYPAAFAALRAAVELSPNYLDGYYDCAQYAALAGRTEESLAFLRKAVMKPLYFALAQKENNFAAIRPELQSLLFTIALTGKLASAYHAGLFELAKYWAQAQNVQSCVTLLNQLLNQEPGFFAVIRNEPAFAGISAAVETLLHHRLADVCGQTEQVLAAAETALRTAAEAITGVVRRGILAEEPFALKASALYREAAGRRDVVLQRLYLAREKSAAGDYVQALEAFALAEQACKLSQNAAVAAEAEGQVFSEQASKSPARPRKRGWRWKLAEAFDLIGSILFWPMLIGIFFAVGELALAFFIYMSNLVYFGGVALGMLIGFSIGLKEEGWRIREFFR